MEGPRVTIFGHLTGIGRIPVAATYGLAWGVAVKRLLASQCPSGRFQFEGAIEDRQEKLSR
jgi:hypothetical protein